MNVEAKTILAMRVTMWLQSFPNDPSIDDIRARFACSRATAYRWLQRWLQRWRIAKEFAP